MPLNADSESDARDGKFQIDHRLVRGFVHYETEEADRLSRLYAKVLESLGYMVANATEENPQRGLGLVKNFLYLPPEGMLMWHTNQYDNRVHNVPYRMYLISTDQDGGSAFKYQLPISGKIVEAPDFHGAVRFFKNTHTNSVSGEES